jgi:hypothetical protein
MLLLYQKDVSSSRLSCCIEWEPVAVYLNSRPSLQP